MKIKESLKKVGAVAGSALMVGMTMGAAQTLGDFPQPFVNNDGTVASQIVVGSQGMQADVVGAINIAASMGNAAVTTEEQTEAVTSAGTGSYGWTASAGGQTLDTVNDQLFFNDNISTVRTTLTASNLDSLEEVTFEDASGTTTDIETFLYPDSKQVQFGQPADRNNEDPVIYVNNPANPSSSDYLFRLQANFENTIEFNSSDVEDEEITLFGNTYTVSTNTDANELKLYGSQVTEDLDTGQSTTVTVEGTELTIEAVSASDSTTGAFRVNGELYERDEEGTVTVGGQTIRLDEVIVTNSDNNEGVIQFAIGSQEYTFQDGQKIDDDDGDAIDGTYVEFSGSDNEGDGLVDELDSIDLYIGSHDDDSEYVSPAEDDGMYSHPNFEDFVFHLGGLNPESGAGAGDNVNSVEVSPSGDDAVTVDFTSDADDSASIEFVHNASGTLSLADDDGDGIHVIENATVMENEFFVSDAGDFPHLWEVTNIDYDNSSDEANVDLQDAVSSDSVTIDVDRLGNNANNAFNGSEVIDGQTYYFHVPAYTTASSNVSATWGTNADVNDHGDRTSVYSPLDAASGEALAFTEPATLPEFPSYSFDTTKFNTSFIDQSIMTDETSGSDTEWVNITGPYHLENFTVNGTDNAGSDYTIWADKANDGTAADNNITASINSTGWGIINMSWKSGVNISSIAINQSRGAGNYSIHTSGTFATEDKTHLGPIQNVTRTDSVKLELPSTESTDAKTTTVDLQQNFSSNISSGHGGEIVTSNDPVTVGQQQYTFTSVAAAQANADGQIDINLYDGSAAVTDPSLLLVEPEDDNDEEHAYTVTPTYSGGSDQEVRVRQIDSYTGSTRQTTSLESDSDVTEGYDFWGTYTSEDSDGQGEVVFHVPDGQATVGAAFTPVGGSLEAGGGGGSGSVTYTAVSGYPSLPDMARLDTEAGDTVRNNNNLILVGGPAVNQLVSDLSEDNDDVWSQQDWLDQSSEGNARLNYVADAFTDGQDALIVAGYAASDTRGAARYLANYADNQASLSGQTSLSLSSADYPS